MPGWLPACLAVQVVGRQAWTGHKAAPGYMPLGATAMANIVSEMRAVYTAAAAELVAAMRNDHG